MNSAFYPFGVEFFGQRIATPYVHVQKLFSRRNVTIYALDTPVRAYDQRIIKLQLAFYQRRAAGCDPIFHLANINIVLD